MSRLFIVPAKPLSRAKMRLANLLDPEQRIRLVLAMLADVTVAAVACGETWVLCSDPEAANEARAAGGVAVADDTPDAGLNPSLERAIAKATAENRRSVTIVASDLPCLLPADLSDLPEAGVTIAPSRDGSGTNVLALGPPRIIAPAFGPDSRTAHETAAKSAGVDAVVVDRPRLALDVDAADDLRRVRALGAGIRTTAFVDALGW